jgi:hypothetical protein
MASRKTTPRLTSDQLADISRQIQQHFFDEWPNILKGEQRPPTRELRAIGVSLVDNPFSINDPDKAPYIYLIIQSWLTKTKPAKRTLSGKSVAELVDLLDKDKTDESQLRARKLVAKVLGKDFLLVKQSHNRSRKKKRGKPR